MKLFTQILLFIISVTLGWDYPSSDMEYAQGFECYYGTQPGVYGEPVVVGKVLQCTLQVDETQPMFFAAKAIGAFGEKSEFSKEIEASTTPRVMATGKHSQLTVIEVVDGKAALPKITILQTAGP